MFWLRIYWLAMARRLRIVFYALNLMVYALGTLALVWAGVEGVLSHKGGQWKDLLLVPAGAYLCRIALFLLRRESRRCSQEVEAV